MYNLLGIHYCYKKEFNFVRFYRSTFAVEDGPLPTTLVECLQTTNYSSFPNVVTMLKMLLITPVTSASVERSNSALRFVKSNSRSMMGEDRLNALLLLFIHKDIQLDYGKIVDVFANRHPRKMTFRHL